MRRVAAPLAAALTLVLLAGGCGGDGAEPGAPRGATLILDFQPNAAHAGIYTAVREGLYEREGIDLEVREPSASTDAPKLLTAGRADLAILDIHDLGLASERGFELVGVASIVGRPLAAVLARSDRVREPAELEGRRVGVTGLPSDDAVLESVVEAGGGDPKAVDRVTIGFNAVPALAAGRLDAATGFWNAEGVALRREGTPVREFRVDDFGAPAYPELILVAAADKVRDQPDLVEAVVRATVEGSRRTRQDPDVALQNLTASVPSLDPAEQRAQLEALLPTLEDPGRLDRTVLEEWARWDVEHGILEREPDTDQLFEDRFLP
jgi:putative hydroxymethylpyrimidine transport system substrate-binding protein